MLAWRITFGFTNKFKNLMNFGDTDRVNQQGSVLVVEEGRLTLSYNAQQFRVRIELTRQMVKSSPVPPQDAIDRARAKMEAVKKEGKIVLYEVFEEKFLACWEALRAEGSSHLSHPISLTLAAGSPAINGLEIVNSKSKPGIFVSTKDQFDFKHVHKDWLKTTLNAKAKAFQIGGLFAPQLQAAIALIAMGEKLTNFHIGAASAAPSVALGDRPYMVMANRSRGEILVYVRDLSLVTTDAAVEAISKSVMNAVAKLKEAGVYPIKFLKTEMIQCLKSSIGGSESIGVGMPMAVLAGIKTEAAGGASIAALSGNGADPAKHASAKRKYLKFTISQNNMLATIDGFDPKLYADPAFVMTKEFMLEQMELSQIRFGLTDELFSALETVFNKRGNLSKMPVAKGVEPVTGAEPYLHLVYKDAPKSAEGDVVNIRDAQQRSFVKKGQCIGEVRYNIKPVVGQTVTGQMLLPAVGAPLALTVGEGVQQKEQNKFYATFDGLPKYEDGKLTINKMLVLEGNVDLKSGNVYFDGPVEIKGSVETGSLVRVKGPLIIHGSIIGATVISKESIEVMESIVTGEKGIVVSGSNVKADFIENSRIEADGAIIANKSIVNCELMAGRLVQVTASDGVIGGGLIICKGVVLAPNLGFINGAKTNFKVGVDHKLMRKSRIKSKRSDNLTKTLERYRNEFREINLKRDEQLTAKHKLHKEELKNKLIQIRPMIDKAIEEHTKAKGAITYNSSAILAASNVFAANTIIEIAGQGVVMPSDTIAAAVIGKKVRDSHIVTFDEARHEISKYTAADETKKAS